MIISVEISYYPLSDFSHKAIQEFIDILSGENNLDITTNTMSTIISGEYDILMNFLSQRMKQIIEKYPSVFILKISNACPV